MRGDKVVLFWSKYDQVLDVGLHSWRNREISVNPSHILSLQSHIKFGHDIHLYTYQPIPHGLPEQVTVHDADEIFPARHAWSALNRGHSIAHISDLVRFRGAVLDGGIVLDMDAIVINELPDLAKYFCTMPAKATGGVAPQWGTAHPPFTIHDDSWDGKALSAFPVKVDQETAEDILTLATVIENSLARPPKKDSKAWNYVLWTIKELSRNHPDAKIFPPIKTCPVPSWMGAGKCYTTESPTRLDGTNTVFGYTLPSTDEILAESYIVQHFFESAFQGVAQETNPATFWFDIPQDSLIGLIAQRTVGDRWRTILPNLTRQ